VTRLEAKIRTGDTHGEDSGRASTGSGGSGATSSGAHSAGGDFEIVAANDLGDANTMAHLLQYDSVLGPLGEEVEAATGDLRRGLLAEDARRAGSRAALPWGDSGVDVVPRVDRVLHLARGRAEAHRCGREEGEHLAPATEPDVTLVPRRQRRHVRAGVRIT
jgi:hypothetical protein